MDVWSVREWVCVYVSLSALMLEETLRECFGISVA